jgi:hypothetical protein
MMGSLIRGVKQVVIAGGSVESASDFNDNTSFKGDIFVDTTGKIQQLFSLRARKDTSRSLLTNKMNAIRKSESPAAGSGSKIEKAEKPEKPEKSEKSEKSSKSEKGDKNDAKIQQEYVYNRING